MTTLFNVSSDLEVTLWVPNGLHWLWDRDYKRSSPDLGNFKSAKTYVKSYRPIFLLCIPYKILERFTYARVEPLIDPLLPKELVEFRRGKSTVDQVVLLTQNIKDSFEAKKNAGAVFVNLTAAL